MLCMCCLVKSPQQPCKLGIIFSYILQIIICPIMIAKALSVKGHRDRWYKGSRCNTVSITEPGNVEGREEVILC